MLRINVCVSVSRATKSGLDLGYRLPTMTSTFVRHTAFMCDLMDDCNARDGYLPARGCALMMTAFYEQHLTSFLNTANAWFCSIFRAFFVLFMIDGPALHVFHVATVVMAGYGLRCWCARRRLASSSFSAIRGWHGGLATGVYLPRSLRHLVHRLRSWRKLQFVHSPAPDDTDFKRIQCQPGG